MDLHVSTYNILFCLHDQLFSSLETLADRIQRPAIIALQEVRNLTAEDDLPARISELFPGMHYTSFLSKEPTLFDLGLATYSTLPIIHQQKIPLHGSTNTYGALVTYHESEDKIVRVTNLHLELFGNIPDQIRQVRTQLEGSADHDILCGDFNTIGWQRFGLQRRPIQSLDLAMDDYTRADHNTWTSDISSAYNTTVPAIVRYPTAFLRACGINYEQCLDHIYTTMDIKDCGVHHDLPGSDHYPVWADLST